MSEQPEAQFKLKVLFVEDEDFTLNMVAELLESRGMTVHAVKDARSALEAIPEFEPHVVVTDLDLGDGPDGSDLLHYIDERFPWVGKVILTSHASPTLAIGMRDQLPKDVTFLIKPLVSGQDIYEAVLDAIHQPDEPRLMSLELTDDIRIISQTQAELLKLMAEGMSNSAIARHRNKSAGTTESLIHRLFVALGISGDPDTNQRVLAVRMWQQGKVRVK